MSFTVHGVDGFLVLVACLLFLAAAFAAWFGHKATLTLISAGLLLWSLTGLVH